MLKWYAIKVNESVTQNLLTTLNCFINKMSMRKLIRVMTNAIYIYPHLQWSHLLTKLKFKCPNLIFINIIAIIQLLLSRSQMNPRMFYTVLELRNNYSRNLDSAIVFCIPGPKCQFQKCKSVMRRNVWRLDRCLICVKLPEAAAFRSRSFSKHTILN